MADMIDREAFIVMLTERYPAVAADIDDCARGLLHLEMGTLAGAAQAAIRDEDTAAVREHFRFIRPATLGGFEVIVGIGPVRADQPEETTR